MNSSPLELMKHRKSGVVMNVYNPSRREVEKVESPAFLGHPAYSTWHIPRRMRDPSPN